MVYYSKVVSQSEKREKKKTVFSLLAIILHCVDRDSYPYPAIQL